MKMIQMQAAVVTVALTFMCPAEGAELTDGAVAQLKNICNLPETASDRQLIEVLAENLVTVQDNNDLLLREVAALRSNLAIRTPEQIITPQSEAPVHPLLNNTKTANKPAVNDWVNATPFTIKLRDGDEVDVEASYLPSTHSPGEPDEPVASFTLGIARYGKFRKFSTNSVVRFMIPGGDVLIGSENVQWGEKNNGFESCRVKITPEDFRRIAFVGLAGAICEVGSFGFVIPDNNLGSFRALWRKSGLNK